MFKALNEDILDGLKKFPIIMFISLTDLRSKYKRTILGPFWIVLGLAAGSIGLGFLWSVLWDVPTVEMLPRITVGFLVWILISAAIVEGSNSLISQEMVIKNINLPFSFFPLLSLCKQVINFLHSLVIILVLYLFLPPIDYANIIWFLPALFLTLINMFLLTFLLAVLSSRFRDIQPLIAAIMPMLFFLSPVLFRIQQTESISWIMWLNPLTYVISILRDPLLGQKPEMIFFMVMIVFTTVLYVLLAILIKKKINNIVYWV